MDIPFDSWIRPEERPFIRRTLDWVDSVRANHQWKLTDFLSPREVYLLESVVGNQGLVMGLHGGAEFADRRRALIMPEDWYPEPSDYEVAILNVTSAEGRPLTHGSILGSVLGTGLDRRKIGDIFTDHKHSYLAICQDVYTFLNSSWHSVGRDAVTIGLAEERPTFDPPHYEPQNISVMSLRIDAIIAQSCHWSRQVAQSAVESGKVSLNFVELKRVDATVAVGDLISVRGFGRISVVNVHGTSKRGRERVEVGVLRSNTSDRT
jgi:RNA-binding protein YlmH